MKQARPKQITPKGNWNTWLILAGRGWGKTKTGAQDISYFGLTNPHSRIAIVAPTFADGRDTCIEGVSGLLQSIPNEFIDNWNRSIGELKLTNGTIYKTFTSEQPDRLRGPQFHRAWCDELGSWKYPETFDQLLFGLRLGKQPQCIITTTPKPNKLIRSLLEAKDIVITRGSTYENIDNLAKSAVEKLKETYEGTRLGRQELFAEVLDDAEGALWNRRLIDQAILKSDVEMPSMERIVVAVDPAVTSNKSSNETGIVICGKYKRQFYVLGDVSGKYTPDGWAKKAIEAFHSYAADRIIAEVNNGGDLVEKVIRTLDRDVSYGKVRASKGKYLRAEPIAALYEQGRVKHRTRFLQLEDQMANYNPQTYSGSPDRLDALVWGITELMQRSGKVYWRVN